MRHPLRVLLIGRSGATLSGVQAALGENRQLLVTVQPLGNGDVRPLSELQEHCNAIVLVASEDWRGTVEAYFGGQPPATKPLLVIGPAGDMELLRTAMRIGGRDFFALPVSAADLTSALDRLAAEEHARHGAISARVTTFINAKGGNGASFCSANFAHILAKEHGRRIVLVDFELQFASLPTYFNLQSRNGLVRALELADSLDVAALQGYIQEHPSGLSLLSAAAEGLVLPEDVHEERVGQLFAVLDEAYEELVVDLPRRIDRGTAAVIDRSDLLMLLAQQTVADLQNVKRLTSLLCGELDIGADRLVVIVNRFQRRAEVTLQDFTDALHNLRIETLPDDYRTASESLNLGIPLLDHNPRAALSKALVSLTESVAPVDTAHEPQRRGPLSWLSGKHH